MDEETTTQSFDTAFDKLSEEQQLLVELYARDPNVTKIAETLGVHRSTIYRRLDEENVQEAVIELRIKLDGDRNSKVEEAQDDVLELIHMQVKQHLAEAKRRGEDYKPSIQDTQRLMQIVEKLGSMKKDVKKAALEAFAKARRDSGGEVDWDVDPLEDV